MSRHLIRKSIDGKTFIPPVEFLVPASTISLHALTVLFPLITALFHLCSAIFYKQYYRLVASGASVVRWAEYSITASMMAVIIAVLSGMSQSIMLSMVFGLSFSLMWLGYYSDLVASLSLRFDLRDPFKSGWLAHFIGYFVFAFYYVPILIYFYWIVDRGTYIGDISIPSAVKAIPWTLFALNLTFAVNQFLMRLRIWRWKDYVFVEYVYLVLSFTAKTVLVGLVAGGILRGDDSNNK